jgi:hypothetical protein
MLEWPVQLGKLTSIPVTSVWPSEPADFTPWLASNIEMLSDCLGFDIEVVQTEGRTDDYRIDIVGRSGEEVVVIENQLSRSDHRHLGQILTYAAAFQAARAIWVVSEATGDHIRAIGFLNDLPSCSFYLVKAEVFRIGESDLAPRFSLIAGPGAIRTEVQRVKSNQSREDSEFRSLWEFALGQIHGDHLLARFFGSIGPRQGPYISASRGLPSGVSLRFFATRNSIITDLYIDLPRSASDSYNDSLYAALSARKTEIEARYGDELDWGRTDRRYRKLATRPTPFDLSNTESWNNAVAESCQRMNRLIQSVEPFMTELETVANSFAWSPEDD